MWPCDPPSQLPFQTKHVEQCSLTAAVRRTASCWSRTGPVFTRQGTYHRTWGILNIFFFNFSFINFFFFYLRMNFWIWLFVIFLSKFFIKFGGYFVFFCFFQFFSKKDSWLSLVIRPVCLDWFRFRKERKAHRSENFFLLQHSLRTLVN